MPKPGDVVTLEFAGVMGVKRRPAVVVSTDQYHSSRPDVVVALLTTQVTSATTQMDHVLLDWAAAGLRQPSAYRAFFGTYVAKQVQVIGHLSSRDWTHVQAKLRLAVAVVDYRAHSMEIRRGSQTVSRWSMGRRCAVSICRPI